jgi:hypothetical protein
MSRSKNTDYGDRDRKKSQRSTKHKHQRSGEKQHLKDILNNGHLDEDLLNDYLDYESETDD